MGMVDFSSIASQSVISLPKLLPFSPEFNIGAILSVIAVYLVSATETIGDTSALCNSALKRTPNESVHHHDVWQHSLCGFRHDGTHWFLPTQHGNCKLIAQRWTWFHTSHGNVQDFSRDCTYRICRELRSSRVPPCGHAQSPFAQERFRNVKDETEIYFCQLMKDK